MDRLSTCVSDMQQCIITHYPCLPVFWITRCLVKSVKKTKQRGGIWYPYHIILYIKITKMESDERAQRKWCNALKLTEYDSFKANRSTVWVQHERAKRAKTPCTPPTLSLAPYTLLSFSLLWVRWWMCMSISVSINSMVQGWRCQGWGGMRSFTLSLSLS